MTADYYRTTSRPPCPGLSRFREHGGGGASGEGEKPQDSLDEYSHLNAPRNSLDQYSPLGYRILFAR